MKEHEDALQDGNLWHKRRFFHHGIVFNGIYYNSPELMAFQRKAGTSLPVEVRANASNARTISVRVPTEKYPLVVPALKSSITREVVRVLDTSVSPVNK